jgi:hypothetical protein
MCLRLSRVEACFEVQNFNASLDEQVQSRWNQVYGSAVCIW